MGIICVEDKRKNASSLEATYEMFSKQPVQTYDDLRAKYHVVKTVIGRGQFGTVRKAYLKADPEKVFAVKSIPKKKLGKTLKKIHLIHRILSTVDHPNIVKFYETYEDDTHFFSVMEYFSGDELVDYAARKNFSELEVSQIMQKALSAIDCLHSKGLVHRDIKPSNFVFKKDGDGEIALIDFGFSRLVKQYETMETRIGTPFYLAPEVIEGEYDHRAEYWSLGVMMHELLVGRFPFGGETTPEVLKNIMKAKKVNLEGNDFLTISSGAKKLLKKLLKKDPAKRISAAEALNHPWIKMGQDPELIEQYKLKKRMEWIERLEDKNNSFDSDSTEPQTADTLVKDESPSPVIERATCDTTKAKAVQDMYRGHRKGSFSFHTASSETEGPVVGLQEFSKIPKNLLIMGGEERRTIA